MRPLLDKRGASRLFLAGIVVACVAACSRFFTQHVAVKRLPFANKLELNVVVNLPEGTALPVAASAVNQLGGLLREIPEVMAIQSCVDTDSPFNSIVENLRQWPWRRPARW